MAPCTKCGHRQARLNRGGLCTACFNTDQNGDAAGTADVDIVPGLSKEEFDALPGLPDNWVHEPMHNLNGGHILKILLLGNGSITNRLEALEADSKIKGETIKKNEETIATNENKIASLSAEIVTLKKVIVNQQVFLEQIQRTKLANNLMITGIPDTPLEVEGAQPIAETEEKVHSVLKELNPAVAVNDYTVHLHPSSDDSHYLVHNYTSTLGLRLLNKMFFKCMFTQY